MALDNCLKQILCGLSRPVLLTFDAILLAAQSELGAAAAALDAAIDVLAIPSAAANAALTLAETAVGSVDSALSMLPLDLIEGCAGLGDLNTIFAGTKADATAYLEGVKQKVARFTSRLNELKVAKALHTAQAAHLDEVHQYLQTHCL